MTLLSLSLYFRGYIVYNYTQYGQTAILKFL